MLTYGRAVPMLAENGGRSLRAPAGADLSVLHVSANVAMVQRGHSFGASSAPPWSSEHRGLCAGDGARATRRKAAPSRAASTRRSRGAATSCTSSGENRLLPLKTLTYNQGASK